MDAGFANWTDVLSIQFGESNPAGGGSPSFSDLSLSKNVDATSPVFAQDAATGADLPAATLQVVNASSLQVYEIQLYNVSVSSLSDVAAGALPTENLTLHFGKMSWTYTQYDSQGATAINITTDFDPAIRQDAGNPVRQWRAKSRFRNHEGDMECTCRDNLQCIGQPEGEWNLLLVTSATATNLAPMTFGHSARHRWNVFLPHPGTALIPLRSKQVIPLQFPLNSQINFHRQIF